MTVPLELQPIDNRKYVDLLEEALVRIPVHNPEWTNFNKSDPGVTIIELWAFLTESLLYRVNQIPERNRRKFLSLLGIPLQPATPSRGLITISNQRGQLEPITTLNDGVEVRAGQIPFRTAKGLDILPIEAQMYYKHKIANPSPTQLAYYTQLYSPYLRITGQSDALPLLYETLPFPQRENTGIDLGRDTVDHSLWIALLARPNDDPGKTRHAILGKTLSLGVVPIVTDTGRQLLPAGQANSEGTPFLEYQLPSFPQGTTSLPVNKDKRHALYKLLDTRSTTNVLTQPGVVEITLPATETELNIWDNLDSLEVGADDFPPALEDSQVNQRVITWIRVTSPTTASVKLLWAGINAVSVIQQALVVNELLPDGTGEPDQVATLAKTPVVPDSVRLTVATPLSMTEKKTEEWQRIDDLMSAGSEVAVPDTRLPIGTTHPTNTLTKVFVLDPESGRIQFGDGLRGMRPPADAIMRVDYAYSLGSGGNIGAGSISSIPTLPSGFAANNPLPTWGGTDAETVSEGEKHITRYLQHRDRLMNVADFEAITLRTPGVDIGRVDVIPTSHPELTPNQAGDAPGAVTLMVIPRYDPLQPDAPQPNDHFLDAICSYLEPRRLVTTEVFVRGPIYKPIWLAVGINVIAGMSIAQVREAVKSALIAFLSPLPANPDIQLDAAVFILSTQQPFNPNKGWPRGKPVLAAELAAVASRVLGVVFVNGVLLTASIDAVTQVDMNGRELPRVAGISVTVGSPLDLAQLQGQSTPITQAQKYMPIPVIPEEC
jgi:hypothetical protein